MKTRRFCPKCGRPVLKSQNRDYTFQCNVCDEDFCRFEILRKRDLAQVLQIRKVEFENIKSCRGYIQSFKKPFHKFN